MSRQKPQNGTYPSQTTRCFGACSAGSSTFNGCSKLSRCAGTGVLFVPALIVKESMTGAQRSRFAGGFSWPGTAESSLTDYASIIRARTGVLRPTSAKANHTDKTLLSGAFSENHSPEIRFATKCRYG